MKKTYMRSSLLFLVPYIMWITVMLLKYTYVKNLIPLKTMIQYAKWIAIVLLIVKFLEDGVYRFQNILGLLLILFWGYRVPSLLMLGIFMYSAANVDFDDILKATLLVQVCVMIITIVFAFAGVIPNNLWDSTGRQRYDLGFTYCTFGSHLMLFITLEYCCIRKRITIFETIILLVSHLWLYSYNNTRLDICIVVPFLVLFYVWTHCFRAPRETILSRLVFCGASVLAAAGSVLLQALYDPANSMLVKLNELLSGRLQLGHDAIMTYGFTWMGQKIRWIGAGSVKKHPTWVYNYVDCSFLKYMLHYGTLFLIFLLIALVLIGKRALQRKDMALCASLLALYVFAIVDAELCVLAFHPFLLKAGEFLNPIPGGAYENTNAENDTSRRYDSISDY